MSDSAPLAPDELCALIERAAAHDESAQRELIERYYARVRTHVHHELQSDFRKRHRWLLALFSTRDVVQDVFTDVVRNLQGCEFETEQAFVAYLKTVVRNRLLDAVRFHQAGKRDARRRVESPTSGPGVLQPDAGVTPDLAADLAEQVRVLQSVMADFPLRHRTLLEMRLVDDVAFPVIAEELGYASAETARQAFWEAKAKLLLRLQRKGVRGSSE